MPVEMKMKKRKVITWKDRFILLLSDISQLTRLSFEAAEITARFRKSRISVGKE
jgi:hypothetical protein